MDAVLKNAKIADLAGYTDDEIYKFVSEIQSPEELSAAVDMLRKAASSPDSGISEKALKVLSLCMCNVQLERIGGIIQVCIRDSDLKVRLRALEELYKPYRYTGMSSENCLSVLECVKSKDTRVGTLAVKIVTNMYLNHHDPMDFSELERLLGDDSVVRCRVYQIAVDCAKTSSKMLELCKNILEKMLSELESKDILMQMSIFEFITSLCEQNHGFSYVEFVGTFEKLAIRAETELNSFDQSQILKFFSGIAVFHPSKVITSYQSVLRMIFSCFTEDSLEAFILGLQTLGNFTHTSEGKALINAHFKKEMKTSLEAIAVSMGNMPMDIKILAFACLREIFKTEGQITQEIERITHEWFKTFSGTGDFEVLLRFFRMPFSDLKEPSLNLLIILIQYEWGILAVRNTAGLIEYLLDRNSEKESSVLHLKYTINETLCKSNIFDAYILTQLQKYVTEGVFYVEAITEIAYERS